jgi:XTP/dITP diphosphohydrolase
MSRRIVLATRNRGKLREVVTVLAGIPAELVTLDDYAGLPDAVEDADTFAENAAKKALHYAGLTRQWALADDSGLEVDALDGAPGVRSARYAGKQGDDSANNAKLIANLRGVPAEQRTARFRCCVALADEGAVLATAAGVFEGLIVDEPRGHNGFGYDPHFFVPAYGMTAAQMPPELKNAVSHRARALMALRTQLAALGIMEACGGSP